MLLGEVGLLLSIIEAGLHVQLPVLRQVGLRGFVVAIVGSFIGPLPIAFFVARVMFSCGTLESVAIAICLVPSSTNIALIYLRRAKVLNTPTGQLVVAATSIDDIIALVCISQLRALTHPSRVAFLEPIVGFGVAIVMGAVALLVMPHIVTRLVVPRVPPRMIDKATLICFAVLTAGLMTALEALKSSYLLGAFLAGFSFCTMKSVLHVWEHQVKRLQTWLLRLFFAATVGFDIPIRYFARPRVIAFAAALMLPLLGKAATGFLAKPLNPRNILTIAFSMTTIGELAFVAAVIGNHELHLTSKESFAAVCLAIIASNVIGPMLLRRTLAFYSAASLRILQAAVDEEHGAHGSGGLIYYQLSARCPSRWGLMADVLKVLAASGVAVLEFRTDATGGDVVYEAYLKDLRLHDASPGGAHTDGLDERLAALRSALAPLLSSDAEGGPPAEDKATEGYTTDFGALRGLLLRRWLPGGSPEEWAANGGEDAEVQATLMMRAEADAQRLAARPPALRDIFPVSSADAPPSSRGAALLSAESAAAAEVHTQAPSEDGDPEPAVAPGIGRLERTLGAGVALARANAADLALAAAAAAAELERARVAAEEDPHGLLGFVRAVRPHALVTPALVAAENAAEATLETVSAAAETAAEQVTHQLADGGPAADADESAPSPPPSSIMSRLRRLARRREGEEDEEEEDASPG